MALIIKTRKNAIVEYLDYVEYLVRHLSAPNTLALIVSEISAFM